MICIIKAPKEKERKWLKVKNGEFKKCCFGF